MAGMFDSQDRNSWYFRALSRTEAQRYLLGTRHGRFLVRDSKTCPGDYVLSVSENAKVSHYIINKLQSQKYKIGDQVFDDLPALIEFYKIHYLDTTTLIEPCPRELSPQQPQPPLLPPPVAPPTQPQDDKYYKALFEFLGRDPDDLPFKKNDILLLLNKDEENWWTMKSLTSNRTGSVPVPYIEECANPNEVIYRPIVPHNGPVKAVVTQQRIPNAYDPQALKLEVGAILTVLEQNINGQWRGELNGKVGTFPFTHVRILQDSDMDS
ncbi:crk-like protein [Saccoglossus kowalevskii]|uniref:CRK-CRKL-like protein ancestral isoform n=1 Tax=Saccoglossus kowalevskii TaxID=10224 RepID=A0A1C9VNQ9_SACKO|nr:CRK-CRKL-like protein ancestral isoform [Saccoglossus kowalevskii]